MTFFPILAFSVPRENDDVEEVSTLKNASRDARATLFFPPFIFFSLFLILSVYSFSLFFSPGYFSLMLLFRDAPGNYPRSNNARRGILRA